MIHKAVDKDKTLSLTTSESESENPDDLLDVHGDLVNS